MSNKQSAFVKEVIVMALSMMGCFILLDLYAPLKRALIGDSLPLSETLTYITWKRHLLVSSIVAVVVVSYRRKKVVGN